MRETLASLEGWLDSCRDDPVAGPGSARAGRPRTSRHGAIVLPFRALLAAIEDARLTGLKQPWPRYFAQHRLHARRRTDLCHPFRKFGLGATLGYIVAER